MASYYGLDTYQTPGASLQKRRTASATPGALPMPPMPSMSASQPVTPLPTAGQSDGSFGTIAGGMGLQSSWPDPTAVAPLAQPGGGGLPSLSAPAAASTIPGPNQAVAPGNDTTLAQFVNPATYPSSVNGVNLSPDTAAGLQLASAQRAQAQNEALINAAVGQATAPGGTSDQYPQSYLDEMRREAEATATSGYDAQIAQVEQESRNGASPVWVRNQKAALESKKNMARMNAIASTTQQYFQMTEQAKMDRAKLLGGMGEAQPFKETDYTNMSDWLYGRNVVQPTEMGMALDTYKRAMGVGSVGGLGGGVGGSPVGPAGDPFAGVGAGPGGVSQPGQGNAAGTWRAPRTTPTPAASGSALPNDPNTVTGGVQGGSLPPGTPTPNMNPGGQRMYTDPTSGIAYIIDPNTGMATNPNDPTDTWDASDLG